MPLELPIPVDSVKGFLSAEEGEALYHHGRIACARGPLLEIGSYCGRSTLYLALACRDAGGHVFAVDHHRGSEEHQPGEMFHDSALLDPRTGQLDTFHEFRSNLLRAGLEDFVIPVVAPAERFAACFQGTLGLVFIDGGHSLDAALADYRAWSTRLAASGLLAIHDVYPDAAQGGQAPITVYRLALASGLFECVDSAGSLRVLRRR
ncbi:MAG: class I SAM-dependent methyltransferase [Chromatocurvus sp.]